MIIELRRDELYVMVWQHPVGPLSARLGMSSAKRREACRVMSIPLPPLGHWQKIVAPAAPAKEVSLQFSVFALGGAKDIG